MERSAWEKLAAHLASTYYFELIIIIAAFWTFLITTTMYRKVRLSFLFVIYSIACILTFSLTELRGFLGLRGKPGIKFVEAVNSAFTLVELCAFIIYFFHIIESRISKRILSLLLGFFALAFLVFMITIFDNNSDQSEIIKSSVILNIVEFCILLITILLYFIQLFTKPPIINLANSPAFWISSGLLIYILASLPMLLFTENLRIKKDLYHLLFVFHYMSLVLLLLTINKAFLCRQPITT